MPLEFHLHDGVLEILVIGHYTTEQVVEAYDRAFAQLPVHQRTAIVVDARRSTTLLSLSDYRLILGTYARHRHLMADRVAIVVADAAHFGGARQIGALLDTVGMLSRPFEDRDEAIAWVRSSDDRGGTDPSGPRRPPQAAA